MSIWVCASQLYYSLDIRVKGQTPQAGVSFFFSFHPEFGSLNKKRILHSKQTFGDVPTSQPVQNQFTPGSQTVPNRFKTGCSHNRFSTTSQPVQNRFATTLQTVSNRFSTGYQSVRSSQPVTNRFATGSDWE